LSWLDILIIIGFLQQKRDIVDAILSKVKPNNVVYGTGIEHMDFEGRNLRVDFDDLSVMSLYLPSVQMRKDYDTIHVYG
jgi:exodeoxyribonuclease-3